MVPKAIVLLLIDHPMNQARKWISEAPVAQEPNRSRRQLTTRTTRRSAQDDLSRPSNQPELHQKMKIKTNAMMKANARSSNRPISLNRCQWLRRTHFLMMAK